MSLDMSSHRGFVVAVSALLGLSACGSSGSTTKSTPAPAKVLTSSSSRPSVKGSDLCAVITAADAATVFAESAQSGPAPGPEPLATGVCIYRHDGDDLKIRNLLQVRVYPGPQFYGERLFPKKTSLSGIGSRAFEAVNFRSHKVEIQFVQHGKTGAVNYTAGAGVDVAAREPAVLAIAKKLAAAM